MQNTERSMKKAAFLVLQFQVLHSAFRLQQLDRRGCWACVGDLGMAPRQDDAVLDADRARFVLVGAFIHKLRIGQRGVAHDERATVLVRFVRVRLMQKIAVEEKDASRLHLHVHQLGHRFQHSDAVWIGSGLISNFHMVDSSESMASF
jgi:hypothetical protein